MDAIFGDNADRLTTVEMRVKGMPRGYIVQLYEAARRHHQAPLGLLAAEKLKSAVGAGERVLIITGAGNRLWLPYGETDGPLGAAALAWSLAKGLEAVPVLVSEEFNLPPIQASVKATGLFEMTLEDAANRRMAATSLAFPMEEAAARKAVEEILAQTAPKAVIVSEKMGVNRAGEMHSVTGIPTHDSAPLHLLVGAARARGILTVGIGDGGNEVGFGAISEEVRTIMQEANKAAGRRGEADTADTTVVDVIVVGTCSNWGAYNICAALAFLLEDAAVLHSPAIERRMLEACTAAGGGDGIYSTTELLVDGISLEVNQAILTTLHEIVRNNLIELRRPY
jgi:hypothetical protein